MGFGRLPIVLPATGVRETRYIHLPSLIDGDDNMILEILLLL
jgi:hypothetical protein